MKKVLNAIEQSLLKFVLFFQKFRRLIFRRRNLNRTARYFETVEAHQRNVSFASWTGHHESVPCDL